MDLHRGRLTRAEFNRLSAAAAIPLKPQPVSLVRSERDLSPHRERIVSGARIRCIGWTYLSGDVAMQVVEHEPDISIHKPIQRRSTIDLNNQLGTATGIAGGRECFAF